MAKALLATLVLFWFCVSASGESNRYEYISEEGLEVSDFVKLNSSVNTEKWLNSSVYTLFLSRLYSRALL